ncbi:MAG: PspC domain-containing protein [Actinobacteria bacterium]|nr:PspC domain-containing protein [Actinomycetota bacterium]
MSKPLRLVRRRTGRLIAGVAAGLGDGLGVGVAYVRAAFLTMATVWGLGGFIYVALWLVAYDKVEDGEPVITTTTQRVGLGVGFAGLLVLTGALGWWPHPLLVLTMATFSFGTAALTDRTAPRPLAALFDPGVDRPSRIRVIIGVALLLGGLSIFANVVGSVFAVSSVLMAAILTAVGAFVAFGPWVRRLAADLAKERGERIRQEERAEVAAHLHDSVLQTLALIQRSDDPARMTMLARHQENELRDWLYGSAPTEGLDMVSTALRRSARKVEEDHGVPVEVVFVGDHPLDETTKSLVGAATEAMVNAAKHSGAQRVSLYFEAAGGELTVYVTDQGKGFDLDAVSRDRMGIANSIRARVERAGGVVKLMSEPGEGTEVMMTMPVNR